MSDIAPGFDGYIDEESLTDRFGEAPPVAPPKPPRSPRTGSSPRTGTGATGRGRGSVSSGANSATDAPAPAVPELTPQARQIVKGYQELYEQVGALMLTFGDLVCGTAIIENAEAAAQSLGVLADKNPKVKKTLLGLLTQGAWSMVLATHAPMLLAIDAHHTQVIPKLMKMLTGGKVPVADE